MGLCPVSEGRGAACLVDERDDDTKLNKEDKDACRARNGGDQTVVNENPYWSLTISVLSKNHLPGQNSARCLSPAAAIAP